MNLMQGMASQLKAVIMAETEVQDEPKADTKIEGTVKVERAGMSMLQWVSVVGLGTVLIAWLVPKMWNNQVALQEVMMQSAREQGAALSESAAAQDAAAKSMDGLAHSMEELAEQQGELVDSLEPLVDQLPPLVTQLNQVADAVREQTTQQAESE